MAGSSGFHVDPAALTIHAGSLDRVADAIDQAGAAGNSVRLGPLAYGICNQTLPLLLDVLQREAVDAAKDSAHSLRTASDTLRELVIRYRAVDSASEQTMNNFGSELNQ